jgi:hypothetical protein
MPTHYIFFRAWLDLSDEFPYDRFNSLPDDLIMDEVHQYCRALFQDDPQYDEIAKRRIVRRRAMQEAGRERNKPIKTVEDTFEDDWALTCFVVQHYEWCDFITDERKFPLPGKPKSFVSRRVFMDSVDSEEDAVRLIGIANNLHPEWRLRFGVIKSSSLSPSEIDLAEAWITKFEDGSVSDEERAMREHAIELMMTARRVVFGEFDSATRSGELHAELLSGEDSGSEPANDEPALREQFDGKNAREGSIEAKAPTLIERIGPDGTRLILDLAALTATIDDRVARFPEEQRHNLKLLERITRRPGTAVLLNTLVDEGFLTDIPTAGGFAARFKKIRRILKDGDLDSVAKCINCLTTEDIRVVYRPRT